MTKISDTGISKQVARVLPRYIARSFLSGPELQTAWSSRDTLLLVAGGGPDSTDAMRITAKRRREWF
jgi:hypothetical protein